MNSRGTDRLFVSRSDRC